MSGVHRYIYFDQIIHLKPIKDCISGKNEKEVIKLLQYLGYKLKKDFVRQYPIGCKYVIDIAFVNEQVSLEVDGKSHLSKKQKNKDKIRDKFLYDNNWVVIRVNEKEFFGGKASFYKYLIKDIVQIRREQYNSGKLYAIDIPDFNIKDYE